MRRIPCGIDNSAIVHQASGIGEQRTRGKNDQTIRQINRSEKKQPVARVTQGCDMLPLQLFVPSPFVQRQAV
jgi:hypothetical protein